MSKEVAAAILTSVYFDKTPGIEGGMGGHHGPITEQNANQIGKVYAAFLQKLPEFEKGASDKPA